MCNDDKRSELKAFYKNPAWARLIEHIPDEQIAPKLDQLRKAREWRISNAKRMSSTE